MVSIPLIILTGLGAITAFFFFRRAGEVGLGPAGEEIGSAIGAVGGGLGSFGSGISALGGGIGSGITGLFQPLLFFRDLLFGNEPIVVSENPNTVHAQNSGSDEILFAGQLGTSVINPGSLTGGFLA